jgi:hypothetical protein
MSLLAKPCLIRLCANFCHQGFQAGFNQALQQAYFNASVGLFGSPLQRGAYQNNRRGNHLGFVYGRIRDLSGLCPTPSGSVVSPPN